MHHAARLLAIVLAVTFFVSHSISRAQPKPQPVAAAKTLKLLILNEANLAASKKKLDSGDESLRLSYEKLLAAANQSLKAGPFTVTDKTELPPSKDKHDYLSFGTYWWPNPDTKDGLPYVRRDGESNPLNRGTLSDKSRMAELTANVETLTLASYFSGQKQFADRAAILLRTWFLDPKTKMNPHLQYAQMIRGVDQGRAIGIVDTTKLAFLIDHILILENSSALTNAEIAGLKKWYADYLTWLQTSDHGKEEAEKKNNHGTAYDIQVASFALFTGNKTLAKTVLEKVIERRVAVQIEPDGKQPLELERTLSLGYSGANLRGLFTLARLGEHVGVEIWNATTSDKRNLRIAFEYIAPYADPKNKWPHAQIHEPNIDSLHLMFIQGAAKYGQANPDLALSKILQFVPQESILRLTDVPANEIGANEKKN